MGFSFSVILNILFAYAGIVNSVKYLTLVLQKS